MKKFISNVGGFFKTLGGCITKTWQEIDSHYYIPKIRFQDREYNRTAYSASQVQGGVGKIGTFLGILKSCISTAWEQSDSLYHIPKTRFRDAAENGEGCRSSTVPGISAPMTSDFIGSGVWSVRPEDQSASSVSEKTAETDGTVYEESGDEAFNPPRLSKE